MAEPGYVYILRSEPFREEGDRYYKIGRSGDLTARIRALKIQIPFEVEVFHTIKCADAPRAERLLHECLAEYRRNGEWFVLPEEVAESLRGIEKLPTAYEGHFGNGLSDRYRHPDPWIQSAKASAAEAYGTFKGGDYLPDSVPEMLARLEPVIEGLRNRVIALGTAGVSSRELIELLFDMDRALAVAIALYLGRDNEAYSRVWHRTSIVYMLRQFENDMAEVEAGTEVTGRLDGGGMWLRENQPERRDEQG